jgi:ATP-dependent Clp protease protease subunit
MPNQFWNFKNVSEDEAELTIYGDIGESWWGDSVSSKKFAKDLAALGPVKNITVRINSGGGDVFAGHAILGLLKDHQAKVTIRTEGLAASAASVIAMSGDEIIMHSTDFMMIHNPASSVRGESKDMTKMAETLDVIKDGIMNAYVKKTGKSKDEISKMMDDETWMTGEDAVRLGFADKLADDPVTNAMMPVLNGNVLIVNGLSHDLSGIKSRPPIKDEADESAAQSFWDKIISLFKNNAKTEQLVENIIKNNLPETKENHEDMEGIEDMAEIKNLEDLKNTYPDLVNQLISNTEETTLKNERTRMQEIDQIANKIDPELVNKAKYEEPVDAKALAFQAIQNDGSKGKEFFENLKKDSKGSGTESVKSAPQNQKTDQEEEAQAVDNIANSANGRRGK